MCECSKNDIDVERRRKRKPTSSVWGHFENKDDEMKNEGSLQ